MHGKYDKRGADVSVSCKTPWYVSPFGTTVVLGVRTEQYMYIKSDYQIKTHRHFEHERRVNIIKVQVKFRNLGSNKVNIIKVLVPFQN